jgi:hypothetical protein
MVRMVEVGTVLICLPVVTKVTVRVNGRLGHARDPI